MRKLHLATLVALAACGNAAGSPLETRRAGLVLSPTGVLAINEVAAAGAPDDWFELINTGDAPLDLSDFVYVDTPHALDRARAFPGFVLAPGERHVQYVTGAVAGFQLASDESLWIYRTDDGALVDMVDWPEGGSPADGSYARMPDATGAFATRVHDTLGEPNS